MNIRNNERGMTLIFIVFILIVLSVVGITLVSISRHETKTIISGGFLDRALYIADGGIEKAINEIKADTSYGGETGTPLGEGVFTTSVSVVGVRRYEITSTGYIPNATNPRGERTIKAVVDISAASPPQAVRAGGTVTVAANITVKGDLRSNGPIVFGGSCRIDESSAGAGDGSVYTSTDIPQGVQITGNLYFDVANQEIKSRGPGDATPHAPKNPDDPNSGVYNEATIQNNLPTITEQDTSDDTAPMTDFPYFDTAELLDGNQTVYPNFVSYSGATFDLDGKVHEFQQGVEFLSNLTFIGGGTIVVSGGSGDYGIEMAQNIDGDDPDGYARVNLIVSGGNWSDTDIIIRQNIKINGLISGITDLTAAQNVDIIGMIECAGDIDVNSNVDLVYGDFGFPIPGSAGEVLIVSWQEIQ